MSFIFALFAADHVQVAGGWELNGSKMWITNGPEADVMVIYARSGPGPKNAHTAFVVDGARVGRGAKLDKLGMRGSNTCPLFLEKVFVPDEVRHRVLC
jgi:isovaleryl-CoA dehydrogenase